MTQALQEAIEPTNGLAVDVVANGATWLDEHYPDQLVRIDPGSVDVDDPEFCPFVQSSGLDFLATVRVHELDYYARCALGFHAGPFDPPYINGLWRQEIERRRQSAK